MKFSSLQRVSFLPRFSVYLHSFLNFVFSWCLCFSSVSFELPTTSFESPSLGAELGGCPHAEGNCLWEMTGRHVERTALKILLQATFMCCSPVSPNAPELGRQSPNIGSVYSIHHTWFAGYVLSRIDLQKFLRTSCGNLSVCVCGFATCTEIKICRSRRLRLSVRQALEVLNLRLN